MRDIDQALLPVSPLAPQAKHDVSKRLFQGIPGVEVTPKGRLWATWYSGGATEGPENYVILSTSADGGKTWKEAWVIDPPGHVRAYDPGLWIDPLGRLWWFWSQCYSRQDGNINDGRAGVWITLADNPEVPTWSAPRRVANGVMMNKPTALSNGSWALPTAVWAKLGGCEALPELKEESVSSVTLTADQGRSFERAGGADVPFRCFDEHMVTELRDGRLWMLVRTHYGLGQSFSRDGGKTWTPGCDSLLGGPNSRFFIRRLASGRLLLVNHVVDPEHPFVRKNLFARLSEDDGKEWLGGLMLDERPNVSYPDGTQAADGSLWVVYDYERYKGGKLLLSHFTEEDVLAGKVVSKESALRIQVSRYPFPK